MLATDSEGKSSSDHEQNRDLLTLLFLTKRLQQISTSSELEFFLVNEACQLHDYFQASLWLRWRGVVAVSGVSQVSQQTPFADWLNALSKQLPVTGQLVSVQTNLELIQSNESALDWRQFVPEHLIFVELPPILQFEGGYLFIHSQQAFDPHFCQLLDNLLESWVSRYVELCQVSAMQRARKSWVEVWNNRKRRNWAIAAVLAFLVFPVRMSVLAPAELIALNPSVVRAPMDGIIGKVYVVPNQKVEPEDKLFDFDETNLGSQKSIALSELETARASYRQAAQQALMDEASKSKLPVLREKVEEKLARLEWLEKLNARAGILAPQSGVVLLNNPDEWNGRSVVTGERILVIAQPDSVQIEAWISSGDLIELTQGAQAKVYLDAHPLSPVLGQLKSISLNSEMKPDGTLGYRARFAVSDTLDPAVRIGHRGTARLSGNYVPLAYWLIRKPLAALRGHLGL